MTVVEKHPHGTAARYAHGPQGDGVDPCRQQCCRDASSAAARARRRSNAYGRGTVDAEPVRAHITALRGQGMSIAEITRRSGLSVRTVGALLYDFAGRPRNRKVTRRTADALLAVVVPRVASGPLVPVHGTRRRLQGLVANGWSMAELARRLGVDHKHLLRVVGHREGRPATLVTLAVQVAVRALFEELWNESPPRGSRHERTSASRALRMARLNRWAVPAAWDDDDGCHGIDVATAVPAGVHGRDMQLETDVMRMVERGFKAVEIARVVGRSSRTVGKVQARARREAGEAA